MSIGLALAVAGALILLNAFFVLAEFALVKIRPTRIEEMLDQRKTGARLVQHMQKNLDEYLSVCQLGITFASVALGAVSEPAFARIFEPLFGSWIWAHATAIALAVVIASFLHILLGEQVPKMIGIRRADGAAIWTSKPLQLFRWIFYLPLILLNGTAAVLLRVFGITSKDQESQHSEDELRILLGRSQTLGMMSFRRLLLMENIFDLGELKVRDAMRRRDGCKTLSADATWEENLKVIRDTRFSRYPLLDGDSEKPLGVIHVKDLLYEGPDRMATVDLRKIARPCNECLELDSLENLLADLQKKRGHLAIVLDDQGSWTGFITLEDIIEEIIGTIEDEFEVEPPLFIADSLSDKRIVLDLKATSIEGAIREAVARVPSSELPIAPERITEAIVDREKKFPTFLGRGMATPHARIDGLPGPVIIFARSEEGVPIRGRQDKAHLFFIIATPSGSPRIQARLLARIAGLMDSEYVEDRMRDAETAKEVFEAIKAGDPVALS